LTDAKEIVFGAFLEVDTLKQNLEKLGRVQKLPENMVLKLAFW